jgi:hypothetical protein
LKYSEKTCLCAALSIIKPICLPGCVPWPPRWGREANHPSPSSSAEVKNGGGIPPLPHMSSWCGTTLPFFLGCLQLRTEAVGRISCFEVHQVGCRCIERGWVCTYLYGLDKAALVRIATCRCRDVTIWTRQT